MTFTVTFHCPKCGSEAPIKRGSDKWNRRECKKCQYVFRTQRTPAGDVFVGDWVDKIAKKGKGKKTMAATPTRAAQNSAPTLALAPHQYRLSALPTGDGRDGHISVLKDSEGNLIASRRPGDKEDEIWLCLK